MLYLFNITFDDGSQRGALWRSSRLTLEVLKHELRNSWPANAKSVRSIDFRGAAGGDEGELSDEVAGQDAIKHYDRSCPLEWCLANQRASIISVKQTSVNSRGEVR